MGRWRRSWLLFSAYRHLLADTDAPEVVAGLRELAAADPREVRAALAAAELLLARASRAEGADERQLAEVTDQFRECVARMPAGHGDRARAFDGYGKALLLASAHRRFPEAAGEAVAASREAVAATPPDGSMRPLYQFGLASALSRHWEETGDVDTLEEAVRVARAGHQASKPGSPDQEMCRTALVTALAALADARRQVEPLHEAVRLARRAVTEARGSAARASAQLHLAMSLKPLFETVREVDLLVEAVEAASAALAATPRSHPDIDLRENVFAWTVRNLADATEDPDTLRQAIGVLRAATEARPESSAALADGLVDLVHALTALHRLAGEPRALDDAEGAARWAVDTAAEGTRQATQSRFALAQVLLLRGRATGEATGRAEEAVALLRAALAETPDAHVDRGQLLLFLGFALRDAAAGDSERMHRAREVFAEAASTAEPPSIRLAGLQELAVLETAFGERAAALAAYEAAVRLLPRLAHDGARYRAAVEEARHTMGLPSDAAAAALDMGRPDRALELLERSRGVLHHRALDARRDLGPPGRPPPRPSDGSAGAEPVAPPSAATPPGSAPGPVVVVNVQERRCDALILPAGTTASVRVVPLPALTQAEAHRRLLRLADVVTGADDASSALRSRGRRQRELHSLLGWLWDCVTAPVLEALDITGPPADGEWPRIWWCPVGEMAYFPLHAAGHHHAPGAETVLDRAVSSYTTTVRALRPPAQDPERPPTTGPDVLAVAMPTTEEAPALPCAAAEVESLRELVPDTTVLSGPEATSERVLDALASHGVAHLACHGVTEMREPAASRLLLHDHHTRPLTVEMVSALELSHAELAFLSACGTSLVNLEVADEAVHITGAFQLAGYRHVIGTLWPADDATAVHLTRATYAGLTRGGTTPPRTEESARALHDAVRELRERYRASPTLWAGHIHLGP